MAIIKKFRIKSFKKLDPIIEIKKLSLSFGKRKILDNINFSINKGQILGLLGPNGVGKSTIFNIITGLIKPDFGDVIINSKKINDFPIYKRTVMFKIGYVPQYGGYFGDLTLFENLKAVSEILIDNNKISTEKINSLISKFDWRPKEKTSYSFSSFGKSKNFIAG